MSGCVAHLSFNAISREVFCRLFPLTAGRGNLRHSDFSSNVGVIVSKPHSFTNRREMFIKSNAQSMIRQRHSTNLLMVFGAAFGERPKNDVELIVISYNSNMKGRVKTTATVSVSLRTKVARGMICLCKLFFT